MLVVELSPLYLLSWAGVLHYILVFRPHSSLLIATLDRGASKQQMRESGGGSKSRSIECICTYLRNVSKGCVYMYMHMYICIWYEPNFRIFSLYFLRWMTQQISCTNVTRYHFIYRPIYAMGSIWFKDFLSILCPYSWSRSVSLLSLPLLLLIHIHNILTTTQ